MATAENISLARRASLWFRSRILGDRAARWNHEYATARPQPGRETREQERFAATALIMARHVPPGRVLELGCGEALLQQCLIPADYCSWTGVDISEVAVGRAQAFAGERVRFLVADMETLEPEGQFDCIVFDESIYHAADCANLLRRYSASLRPGGVFIISIVRTARNARVWAAIHSVATTIDAVATTNALGTWDCEVLGPCAATTAD